MIRFDRQARLAWRACAIVRILGWIHSRSSSRFHWLAVSNDIQLDALAGKKTTMLKPTAFVAAVFAVSITAVSAAPVRHAGEWEIIIDKGQPQIVCFPVDETFDENLLTRSMSKVPGASCKVDGIKTVGDVSSYSMECNINGSTLTSNGTIAVTGPDAFTSKVHTKGGVIQIPNGKTVPIPESEIVTVSRRLGACKPGERQITH